jgi:hypothetical protein
MIAYMSVKYPLFVNLKKSTNYSCPERKDWERILIS